MGDESSAVYLGILYLGVGVGRLVCFALLCFAGSRPGSGKYGVATVCCVLSPPFFPEGIPYLR